jgi:hypothetical protein
MITSLKKIMPLKSGLFPSNPHILTKYGDYLYGDVAKTQNTSVRTKFTGMAKSSDVALANPLAQWILQLSGKF